MYIPTLQIRYSKVVLFQKWDGDCNKHKRDITGFQSGQYTGQMTNTAGKNLKKAMDLMLQISPERWIYNPVIGKQMKFKINFLTLTVPDTVNRTAAEITKNALEPTLRKFRNMGLRNYIWKAELQTRGQVHYHLITDQFIHYETLNRAWNRSLKKHGYLDTYAKKNGHFYPNSTDVHRVDKIKDIEAYMGKYMLKGIGGNATKGKVWDCSRELKDAKFFSTELISENDDKIHKYKIDEFANEHCYIADVEPRNVKKILSSIQLQSYDYFIKSFAPAKTPALIIP